MLPLTGIYAYLRSMRLLLSFILSCFFFAAPFKGSAGDVAKYIEQKLNGNIPQTDLLQKTAGNDGAAAITSPIYSSTYSTRNNFVSFTDFINAVFCVNNAIALPEKKYFSHPYLYCKPIGLVLLFPKHYFW